MKLKHSTWFSIIALGSFYIQFHHTCWIALILAVAFGIYESR